MNIIAPRAVTARLEAAVAILAATQPFYGMVLKTHDIVATSRGPQTVSVSRKLILVNPNYIATLDDDQLVYVLAVMILLVTFDVANRCEDRDPHVWNIAALYVVNAMLVAQGVIQAGRLPVGSMFDANMHAPTVTIDEVYGSLMELSPPSEPLSFC